MADSGDPAVGAMLDELRAAGIETTGFGAFSASAEWFDHARAAPILLRWLPQIEDPGARESIVRSLTAEPEARSNDAARVLVTEFARSSDDNTRWAIGNALATLAEPSVATDLIRLLCDRRYGTARQMLCEAVERTGDVRTALVLVEMINDDDVAGHAVAALRSFGRRDPAKIRDARSKLEELAQRPTATPFARKQARQALAEIDAAE
jgi:HEAT repeat protein